MISLFRFLSAAWMGLIFYLSSLSAVDLTKLPKFNDVLGHGLLFFVLSGFLYFSTGRQQGRTALVISALYGLSDEFHQHFVPGRTPELKDLLTDITAALTAVLMIKAASRLFKNRAAAKHK